MARDETPLSAAHPVSPYAPVKDWAEHASASRLLLLFAVSGAWAALVLLLAPGFWPLAGIGGTGGLIAAWGWLAHRIARDPNRLLPWLQRACVGLGTLLAALAALAILFGMLGPRWML